MVFTGRVITKIKLETTTDVFVKIKNFATIGLIDYNRMEERF